MALRLLYFAWVRERVGTGEEQVTPPEAVATAAQLIDWLAKQSEAHAAAFADRDRLRVAIDQKFAALDTPLGGAREVAIFPPVTGG
ncbi:molybdopterin converting factor subunit 1 [Sphingomonas sp. SFZ2018-12]|uniref:molybdopterin converting factor subunit 1 n=1 Tax=Sphingomonas sp. SFZ2018-12 TaxID=2683197 RepID=UPI001F0F78EF|nr:molybdopterin converting factor subunit 1 [Sphingomonas sp. SFZ2018-12]MCH4893893.1 molybdopterin converting factor subunit 1 [Sphingomonas sp. SFZ2018-12]